MIEIKRIGTNIAEMNECLKSFNQELSGPIKTFIFQNNMSEKLLVQAPWAKFNRNVFIKKALENVTNDGIRLIFEHEKNWYAGITEDHIEAVFSEVYYNFFLF